MLVLAYDHSFEGFLTAVFGLYADHGYGAKSGKVAKIVRQGTADSDLFAEKIEIITDAGRAQRVLARLEKLLGKRGVEKLIWAFLSEKEETEACLLGVITYALQQPGLDVLGNFAHPAVLQLAGLVKSVSRERHHMLAFVRFEKMHNGVYFAVIEPEFNVLPLIAGHFRRRYQDQSWVIFDAGRRQGIYFDLHGLHLVDDVNNALLRQPEPFFSEEEKHYQTLWQGYLRHLNISERSNPRLHVRQLPTRYWRYLTEKKSG